MGRTLRFNNNANSFVQGTNPNNVSVSLFMLGGKDQVNLNRSDDLGGGNFVNAGSGNDTVVNRKEGGSIIKLGSGNDTYAADGFASFGSDRGDTVFGGGGNDKIVVSTFKSSYNGNTGNDTFITVGWENRYDGGAGIDTINYSERDFDSTQGGTGVTVDLGARKAQTGASRFETVIRIENVIGTNENDALFGDKKANVLTGGGGFDELTGRGGADTFVWRSVKHAPMSDVNIDVVADFSAAQGDRINLRSIDANANIADNQAFKYINTAEFSHKAGELRFEDRILSGDRDGDGNADFRIGFEDLSTLSSSSILL